MNVIRIDFRQPAQHVRLARSFARITGIGLCRLLAAVPAPKGTS